MSAIAVLIPYQPVDAEQKYTTKVKHSLGTQRNKQHNSLSTSV